MARRFDENGNKKSMGYEMRLDTIEGGSVYLIFNLEGKLMTASTKGNYGGHLTDETPDRETLLQTCWGKVRITPDFYKPRAIRKSARKMLEGGAQGSTVSFTLQTTWGEKYSEIIDGAINEWKDEQKRAAIFALTSDYSLTKSELAVEAAEKRGWKVRRLNGE